MTGGQAGGGAEGIGPMDVLAFWRAAGPDKWFTKDFALDAEMAARFCGLWRAAAEGKLASWEETPEGALAIAIVLDQFPRNMFRGQARTYATDAVARAVAFSQGFNAPPGEIYCGTEAHKGELGFYIVSAGGGKPYRLKIRAPSFIHMGAFDHMSRGYMIADAVTIFGTYDIVMGECDR